MRRTFWHRSVHRPIRDADEGRFLLGRSAGGWVAGYVRPDGKLGPYIDTGVTRSPQAERVAASALRVYTFLDAPPPWTEDENTACGSTAKVVPFRR